MLANITPVILTFNEAANISRSLERLAWAGQVVIVDVMLLFHLLRRDLAS